MEKFLITAKKAQLKNCGIDRDLSGCIGELVEKYPTGWYRVKVKYEINGLEHSYDFDIPKTFLESLDN